jgi:hypothetical protein
MCFPELRPQGTEGQRGLLPPVSHVTGRMEPDMPGAHAPDDAFLGQIPQPIQREDAVAFVTLYVRAAYPGEHYPQPATFALKPQHAHDDEQRDALPSLSMTSTGASPRFWMPSQAQHIA